MERVKKTTQVEQLNKNESENLQNKVEELRQVNINERLKKLGLTSAAQNVDAAAKMKFAYKNYLFITSEKIIAFNAKLRKDSSEINGFVETYKSLIFIPLEKYIEVPPSFVLDALEKARNDNCFDTFEIAKIDWIREVKDPIVFGRIKSCDDRFFISQWDDDVNIEDILFMDMKDK